MNSSARKLTAMIVEDHAMVSEMLSARLADAGFTILGVAASANEGIALYGKHKPDLVLCDVRLDGGSSGIDMTRRLIKEYPSARVVMVSAENDGHVVKEAYAAGAVGYVSKKASGPELLQTIADAMSGVLRVSDRHTYRKIIAALQTAPVSATIALTQREQETLHLMAGGTSTTNALAAALGISGNSVRTHVDNLMRKLGVHSRAEAVSRAYQLGLIQQSH